jgi:hypothetical protein
VDYQSREDWRQLTDILRVNENYHGGPRYDSVLVNSTDMPNARLELLFRIQLPSGTSYDLALVRAFKACRWTPPTRWNGCRVVEDGEPRIISLKYIERGSLVVNTDLLKPGGRMYYIDDMVDNDMFLRINNID